jgi:hypothetical protein
MVKRHKELLQERKIYGEKMKITKQTRLLIEDKVRKDIKAKNKLLASISRPPLPPFPRDPDMF